MAGRRKGRGEEVGKGWFLTCGPIRSQTMQDLTGKLLRLEFKTKTFGSDGKEALKDSRIRLSRRQCWSPPHELGGFFLASKSFLISSSFLARFGMS